MTFLSRDINVLFILVVKLFVVVIFLQVNGENIALNDGFPSSDSSHVEMTEAAILERQKRMLNAYTPQLTLMPLYNYHNDGTNKMKRCRLRHLEPNRLELDEKLHSQNERIQALHRDFIPNQVPCRCPGRRFQGPNFPCTCNKNCRCPAAIQNQEIRSSTNRIFPSPIPYRERPEHQFLASEQENFAPVNQYIPAMTEPIPSTMRIQNVEVYPTGFKNMNFDPVEHNHIVGESFQDFRPNSGIYSQKFPNSEEENHNFLDYNPKNSPFSNFVQQTLPKPETFASTHPLRPIVEHDIQTEQFPAFNQMYSTEPSQLYDRSTEMYDAQFSISAEDNMISAESMTNTDIILPPDHEDNFQILPRHLASYETNDEEFNTIKPKPLLNYLHYFEKNSKRNQDSYEFSAESEEDGSPFYVTSTESNQYPITTYEELKRKDEQMARINAMKQTANLEKVVVLGTPRPRSYPSSHIYHSPGYSNMNPSKMILVDRANILLKKPKNQPFEQKLIQETNGFDFGDDDDTNAAASSEVLSKLLLNDYDDGHSGSTEFYSTKPSDLRNVAEIATESANGTEIFPQVPQVLPHVRINQVQLSEMPQNLSKKHEEEKEKVVQMNMAEAPVVEPSTPKVFPIQHTTLNPLRENYQRQVVKSLLKKLIPTTQRNPTITPTISTLINALSKNSKLNEINSNLIHNQLLTNEILGSQSSEIVEQTMNPENLYYEDKENSLEESPVLVVEEQVSYKPEKSNEDENESQDSSTSYSWEYYDSESYEKSNESESQDLLTQNHKLPEKVLENQIRKDNIKNKESLEYYDSQSNEKNSGEIFESHESNTVSVNSVEAQPEEAPTSDSMETVFCTCHKFTQGKWVPLNDGAPFIPPEPIISESQIEQFLRKYQHLIHNPAIINKTQNLLEAEFEDRSNENIDEEEVTQRIDKILDQLIDQEIQAGGEMCPHCNKLKTSEIQNLASTESQEKAISYDQQILAKNPQKISLIEKESSPEYSYEYISEEPPSSESSYEYSSKGSFEKETNTEDEISASTENQFQFAPLESTHRTPLQEPVSEVQGYEFPEDLPSEIYDEVIITATEIPLNFSSKLRETENVNDYKEREEFVRDSTENILSSIKISPIELNLQPSIQRTFTEENIQNNQNLRDSKEKNQKNRIFKSSSILRDPTKVEINPKLQTVSRSEAKGTNAEYVSDSSTISWEYYDSTESTETLKVEGSSKESEPVTDSSSWEYFEDQSTETSTENKDFTKPNKQVLANTNDETFVQYIKKPQTTTQIWAMKPKSGTESLIKSTNAIFKDTGLNSESYSYEYYDSSSTENSKPESFASENFGSSKTQFFPSETTMKTPIIEADLEPESSSKEYVLDSESTDNVLQKNLKSVDHPPESSSWEYYDSTEHTFDPTFSPQKYEKIEQKENTGNPVDNTIKNSGWEYVSNSDPTKTMPLKESEVVKSQHIKTVPESSSWEYYESTEHTFDPTVSPQESKKIVQEKSTDSPIGNTDENSKWKYVSNSESTKTVPLKEPEVVKSQHIKTAPESSSWEYYDSTEKTNELPKIFIENQAKNNLLNTEIPESSSWEYYESTEHTFDPTLSPQESKKIVQEKSIDSPIGNTDENSRWKYVSNSESTKTVPLKEPEVVKSQHIKTAPESSSWEYYDSTEKTNELPKIFIENQTKNNLLNMETPESSSWEYYDSTDKTSHVSEKEIEYYKSEPVNVPRVANQIVFPKSTDTATNENPESWEYISGSESTEKVLQMKPENPKQINPVPESSNWEYYDSMEQTSDIPKISNIESSIKINDPEKIMSLKNINNFNTEIPESSTWQNLGLEPTDNILQMVDYPYQKKYVLESSSQEYYDSLESTSELPKKVDTIENSKDFQVKQNISTENSNNFKTEIPESSSWEYYDSAENMNEMATENQNIISSPRLSQTQKAKDSGAQASLSPVQKTIPTQNSIIFETEIPDTSSWEYYDSTEKMYELNTEKQNINSRPILSQIQETYVPQTAKSTPTTKDLKTKVSVSSIPKLIPSENFITYGTETPESSSWEYYDSTEKANELVTEKQDIVSGSTFGQVQKISVPDKIQPIQNFDDLKTQSSTNLIKTMTPTQNSINFETETPESSSWEYYDSTETITKEDKEKQNILRFAEKTQKISIPEKVIQSSNTIKFETQTPESSSWEYYDSNEIVTENVHPLKMDQKILGNIKTKLLHKSPENLRTETPEISTWEYTTSIKPEKPIISIDQISNISPQDEITHTLQSEQSSSWEYFDSSSTELNPILEKAPNNFFNFEPEKVNFQETNQIEKQKPTIFSPVKPSSFANKFRRPMLPKVIAACQKSSNDCQTVKPAMKNDHVIVTEESIESEESTESTESASYSYSGESQSTSHSQQDSQISQSTEYTQESSTYETSSYENSATYSYETSEVPTESKLQATFRPGKRMTTIATTEIPLEPRLATTLRNVFGSNAGRVVTATEMPVTSSTERNLIDGQLFFVGNGVKIPLVVTKNDKGEFQLSLDVSKMCQKHCNMRQVNCGCNSIRGSSEENTASEERSFEHFETTSEEYSGSQSTYEYSQSDEPNNEPYKYQNNPMSKTLQDYYYNNLHSGKRPSRKAENFLKSPFSWNRQQNHDIRGRHNHYRPKSRFERAVRPEFEINSLLQSNAFIRKHFEQGSNKKSIYLSRINRQLDRNQESLNEIVQTTTASPAPFIDPPVTTIKTVSTRDIYDNRMEDSDNLIHKEDTYSSDFDKSRFPSIDFLTRYDETVVPDADEATRFSLNFHEKSPNSFYPEKKYPPRNYQFPYYTSPQPLEQVSNEDAEFYKFLYEHLRKKQENIRPRPYEYEENFNRLDEGLPNQNGNFPQRFYPEFPNPRIMPWMSRPSQPNEFPWKDNESNDLGYNIPKMEEQTNRFETVPAREPEESLYHHKEQIPSDLEKRKRHHRHHHHRHRHHRHQPTSSTPVYRILNVEENTMANEIIKSPVSVPSMLSMDEEKDACDEFVHKRLGLVRSLVNWVRDWVTETAVKTKMAISAAS